MEREYFLKCKRKLQKLLRREDYKLADELYERIVENITISEEEIEELELLYTENT